MAVDVKTDRGYLAQTLYIQPTPEIVAAYARKERIWVRAGEKIGVAQDIHMLVVDETTGKIGPAYPEAIPQHVHVDQR